MVDEDNIIEKMRLWLAGSEEVPPRSEFQFSDYTSLFQGVRIEDIDRLYTARLKYIAEFGFSIPCQEALDRLTAGSPLLEVGSGTGYWSLLIRNRGGHSVATDFHGLHRGEYSFPVGVYQLDEVCSAEDAVRRYTPAGFNVFCSWPCYNDSWLTEAIRWMEEDQFLFLIGESREGCTGDETLFDALASDFEHIEEVAIPRWSGIRDYLSIYRRTQ